MDGVGWSNFIVNQCPEIPFLLLLGSVRNRIFSPLLSSKGVVPGVFSFVLPLSGGSEEQTKAWAELSGGSLGVPNLQAAVPELTNPKWNDCVLWKSLFQNGTPALLNNVFIYIFICGLFIYLFICGFLYIPLEINTPRRKNFICQLLFMLKF